MVETVEGVEVVDDILAVTGIDAVFVGPNDLAVSAGLDSGYEGRDPSHRRMIERIAESARDHHVTAGIMCGTPEVAKQWHEVGYQMLALDADTRPLTTATQPNADRAKN